MATTNATITDQLEAGTADTTTDDSMPQEFAVYEKLRLEMETIIEEWKPMKYHGN